MKTGIIIHSRTNNTATVGERLLKALRTGGQEASMERVMAVNEDGKPGETILLASTPDPAPYGFIVLGAPVHGFRLSLVMHTYLSQLAELRGRKIVCFVTQSFPKPWMGGKQALRQLVTHAERLGGTVVLSAVINWSSKKRGEQIDSLVSDLSKTKTDEKP